MRRLLPLAVLVLLAGCATAPPTQPDNLCQIFREKKDWYRDARDTQKKWSIPIPVMMATFYQESRFVSDARPARVWHLGFIPGGRPSDAYGYAQSLGDTWEAYIKSTGNHGADRDDFADSLDFIGWYYDTSHRRNGIARDDAYRLYLTYHEGQGGYERRTYAGKGWLLAIARSVADRSHRYEAQLKSCIGELEKASSGWFW